MSIFWDEEDLGKVSHPNRLKKQQSKTHRITAEHGRGLKSLWQRILTSSAKAKKR